MRSTIAIITCYFGRFPWYFPYFLHSCKFNPTVDFIIVTDSNERYNLPNNVYFIKRSINDIERIATKKLGFEVTIPYAYKLCDIKPAYGLLFSNIIKKYDFWGHGDIDVLHGNIRKFMTEKILTKYEIISVRHDYITGTFTLFKNNCKMNTLFMQSKDYIKVFSSPNHYCFDECNFLWEDLEAGKSIYELPYEIESMTHVVKQLSDKGNLKAHFDFLIVEGTPGHIKWTNGKIVYKNKFEALLYHLIRFKKICKKKTVFKKMPATIYFSKSNIYKRYI
jgi:hypothetical protein